MEKYPGVHVDTDESYAAQLSDSGLLRRISCTFVGLAKTDAAMAVVSQFVLIFSTLLHGYLSDVVGRKRWLLLGCVLVIPAMFFAFTYAEHGTLGSAIIAAVVPVMVFPMVTSGMTISLVDMFPAEMRASAGAMAYNTGYRVVRWHSTADWRGVDWLVGQCVYAGGTMLPPWLSSHSFRLRCFSAIRIAPRITLISLRAAPRRAIL
ncbi:MFS transporter (plasmid) [Pseudomonas silvicola]|nr:MFS transporter [Pseudomonas silvicola]